MTKSISITIVTFLLLISFCACGVPNETKVGQSNSSNIANNTPASEAITSLPPSLSESDKQLIRSRYITDTYYTISKGDYISKLVEEKKREEEEKLKKSISRGR